MNVKNAVDFFKQFYGWKSDSIWVLTKEDFDPDKLHKENVRGIISTCMADYCSVFMDSPDIRTCSLAFALWSYANINGKCFHYSSNHQGKISDVINNAQFILAHENKDINASNFNLSDATPKTQKWFFDQWFNMNVPIMFIKSVDNPSWLRTGFVTGSFADALYMHSIREMFNLDIIPAA